MNFELRKQDLQKLEKQAEVVAATLGAMANANRLMILCHLTNGEKTVSELVEALSLAQSVVSQHLTIMRNLKLVGARRDGKNVHYSIASEEVNAIMRTLYAVYCGATPEKALL